jgi:uncharacterized protein YwgA
MRRRQLLPLVLLGAEDEEPVEGRTRLQKLMFLIQKRMEEQGDPLDWGYPFQAYDYGPFAKELYDDLDQLRRRGLVEEREQHLDDDVIQYDYVLTSKGREFVREELEDRRPDGLAETTEAIKDDFNDVSLQKLIDYVYTEYPEYAENSVL